MGRIEEGFAALRTQGRKALVAYVCVGDPNVETSIAVADACVRAGADILELGVPFSDPIADGPVIARASERAIRGGGSLRAALRAATALRALHPSTPLVLFTYTNPVFVRGSEVVAEEAAAAGVDALLVVDLPPEEGADLRGALRARGLSLVPLMSPTSTVERTRVTLEQASGFVYYVSVTGVTGSVDAPLSAASHAAAALRERGKLPVVVGFGVDSPEKAREAAGPSDGGADGVVVGTAIVRLVEASSSREQAVESVFAFVRTLRVALDREMDRSGVIG